MSPILICVATLLLGIDYGYQPLPDGGVEYIIQIPPHQFDAIKDGRQVIESDVPREVKDIRGYRIQVGTQPLPRILPPRDARDARDARDSKDALDRSPMLLPEVSGSPIDERKAAYIESKGPPRHEEAKTVEEPKAQAQEPPRPWTLFIAVQLALFASLGGNAYLGWLLWDSHKRGKDSTSIKDNELIEGTHHGGTEEIDKN
jgi:hypothetical protein